MHDTFYEQFVTQKSHIKDWVLKLLLFVGTALLILIGFYMISFFVIVPAALVIYLIYTYILLYFRREVEYSLSNHSLDIAIIYNKEKRKDVLSIDVQKAEIIAPCGSPRLNHFRPVKTHDFTSGYKNAKAFSIMILVDGSLHNIIIEPNEKMTSMIKNWVGSKIYLD